MLNKVLMAGLERGGNGTVLSKPFCQGKSISGRANGGAKSPRRAYLVCSKNSSVYIHMEVHPRRTISGKFQRPCFK